MFALTAQDSHADLLEATLLFLPQHGRGRSDLRRIPRGVRRQSSLTSWVGGTRSLRISSENQIKLERVYVRMPRHQEPTKDVA